MAGYRPGNVISQVSDRLSVGGERGAHGRHPGDKGVEDGVFTASGVLLANGSNTVTAAAVGANFFR